MQSNDLPDIEAFVQARPHHVRPHLASARVILAVKNFSSTPGVCHIGLGVTAINTMKVLRRAGVQVEAWSTQTAEELENKIEQESQSCHRRPLSHVVVSAPSWVQPGDFSRLCLRWPDIEFVQLNHSGCAYLSIDKFGIKNIRQGIDLEHSLHNMRVAGNNPRFTNWATESFGFNCLLLPNLYDTESFVDGPTRRRDMDPIRIGSFGASRPWKNQLVAAEAAVALAHRLDTHLEFYVNSKRPDGGERMIESRKELFDGLPGCSLIEVPWEQWPKFRDIVRKLDLLFSPSFDETFNVVTADGIAEGVPSVVTSAIEWTPKHWWCDPEDPSDLVRVAMGLLQDQNAMHDARRLLRHFVANGLSRWLNYLMRRPAHAV